MEMRMGVGQELDGARVEAGGDAHRRRNVVGRGQAAVKGLTAADCQCDPGAVKSEIRVTTATLGPNCGSINTQLPAVRDNALQIVQVACDGKDECSLKMDDINAALYNNPSIHGEATSTSLLVWQSCLKEMRMEFTCSQSEECGGDDSDTTCSRNIKEFSPGQGTTLNATCPQSAARKNCLSVRAACARCMLDAADSTPLRVIPYGVGGQLGSLPDGIGTFLPPQDAWVDNVHHMQQHAPDTIPGFEFAVPV